MRQDNPSINFVGRANANNGVTAYIDKVPDMDPYPAGYLTVSLGGEYLGSCFVQEKPFYTSQNVNVLIPRHNMDFLCKQYIATMIFKEGRLHYKAFIDELNRHMRTDFSIPLPVKNDGSTIDWDRMRNFMLTVKRKATTRINLMSNLQS